MLLSELVSMPEIDDEYFPLFEMANLEYQDTGINMGIIYIEGGMEADDPQGRMRNVM